MKKITLFVLLLLCKFFIAAQTYNENEDVKFNLALRHIKGIQTVDGSYGFTALGSCIEVNYSEFLFQKVFIMPGINIEAAGIGLSVFKDYTAHLGFGWTVYHIGQRFYVNFPFGVFLGVETIKPYQDASIDFSYVGANKFICGGFIGINPEFFLFKRLSIMATVKEMYIWNCPFGDFKYEVMGGLRFSIN